MKKLIIIALLLIMPTLAYSHVYLLECNPEENTIVETPPETVRITFVGSVETVFSKIEVFDKDGTKVSKETKFFENDTIMEVGLEENLTSGKYTVKWTCMSLDGHKQTGEYTFTIA